MKRCPLSASGEATYDPRPPTRAMEPVRAPVIELDSDEEEEGDFYLFIYFCTITKTARHLPNRNSYTLTSPHQHRPLDNSPGIRYAPPELRPSLRPSYVFGLGASSLRAWMAIPMETMFGHIFGVAEFKPLNMKPKTS